MLSVVRKELVSYRNKLADMNVIVGQMARQPQFVMHGGGVVEGGAMDELLFRIMMNGRHEAAPRPPAPVRPGPESIARLLLSDMMRGAVLGGGDRVDDPDDEDDEDDEDINVGGLSMTSSEVEQQRRMMVQFEQNRQ
jgi:hypothetical protein